MQYSNIDDILEKYWEGESSLEQESLLKQYFASNEVAPEHLGAKALFQFYAAESNVSTDVPLKIEDRKVPTDITSTKEAKVFNLRRWMAAAAVVTLAIAGIFLIKNTLANDKTEMANRIEVEDPELALEYTKQALAMVSKNYNNGTSQISKGMAGMNEVDIFK